MQRIKKVSGIELNDDLTQFTSGILEIEFTVSHSQDIKTDGDERATGEDVPHTAKIDVTGAKVEDVLQQASKPRIISLQNRLKGKYKTADAFERGVNGNKTPIKLVPEGRRKKDPKQDMQAFIAGLDEDEKAKFQEALMNDTVDEFLEEYFGE